jgi:hypothetical protein
MLSTNRPFHYKAELTLKRSRVLLPDLTPGEDIVNWLFLEMEPGGQQYSFVYVIEEPDKARYLEPFKVRVAFTWIEAVRDAVKLFHNYNAFRGPEEIGNIKLVDTI